MDDTIVAISTPQGVGGLGIVRLSGNEALNIAQKIFQPKNKTKIVSSLPTFTVHLGFVIDNGSVLDEVLLTVMRKPHSYTCEDVVEFSCHGGLPILKRLVEICIENGARLAEPGEFTKRAFLNGRIDISEAEAVCDIINSRTIIQTKLATYSLLGKTKTNIELIIEELKTVIADSEAILDFSDEEDVDKINLVDIKSQVENINKKIGSIIFNTEKLVPLMTGINIAIIGKPNVGKSSLLNILLNYDRAIVSEIPGTTRDTVSETVNIKNVPVRIVDTAGIRTHTQDIIEKLGIERTQQAIAECDTVIFILDSTSGLTAEDESVMEILNQVTNETKKNVILVINKIDLGINKSLDEKQINNFVLKFSPNINFVNSKNKKSQTPILKISCKTQDGINELEDLILFSANLEKNVLDTLNYGQDTLPDLIVTNIRQVELLKSVKKELDTAINIDIKKSTELFCEHLRNGAKELLKITGGEITEDVLDKIFSKFCIGK